MTLTFEQTIEDYTHFSYIQYFSRKPLAKLLRALQVILVFAIVALLIFSKVWDSEALIKRESTIPILLWLVISLFLKTKKGFAFRLKYLQSRSGSINLGMRKMILAEDKLTVVIPSVSSDFSWDGITEITEDKRYLYLFVSKIEAIILPKRIFLLEQELYNVKSFIESKVKSKF